MDLPIKGQLLEYYGRDTCISWFSKLKLKKIKGDVIILFAPSAFIAEYVEEHFGDKILEIWQNIGNGKKTKHIKFLS